MPKPTLVEGASPRERVLTRTKNSTVSRPLDVSQVTRGGGLSDPGETQVGFNPTGNVSSAMVRRENPLTRLSTETAERAAEQSAGQLPFDAGTVGIQAADLQAQI